MAPIFDFKAYNPSGKLESGIVEADSPRSARQKLKKRNLIVTSITEKRTSMAASGEARIPLFGGRFKIQDISLMTRQLASLVRANVPLVESLTALVDQTDHPKLKVVLAQVRQEVNQGSSLSKAMKKHPGVYDTVYVNMVEAGESSGTLPTVLVKLANLKEAQVRLRGKIVSSMTYPVLMMVVAIAITLFIFTFLIPQLSELFESSGKPIPPITVALMHISSFVVDWWPMLLAAFFMSLLFFSAWVRTKPGRAQWDRMKLDSPLFGSLIRMVAVARFSGAMSTLLASGVPILTALRIAKNLVGNVHIEAAINAARENITEGQSIAIPLKKSGEFPPMVIHMIGIGERTGELPDMLQNVADTYEEQVSAKIAGLTSLLEPAMIVMMGGMVLLVVVAVIVPILDISSIQ